MIDGNADGGNLNAVSFSNRRGASREQKLRPALHGERSLCFREVNHRADVSTVGIDPPALLTEMDCVTREIAQVQSQGLASKVDQIAV